VNTVRIVIDTDAGVDDAQAIMMALSHPGVTVEAVTTLTGNVHVNWVVPNVSIVLDVMGADVPIYRGADQPLLPGRWHPETTIHGEDGLGNYKNRPQNNTRPPKSAPAAVTLVRLANEMPGELTLVALGPLTNIALACKLDPTFPQKIKQFVFMGGTISAVGNTHNVSAEFNIYCDPEAALITLDAFPRSMMVSWETTLKHTFSWNDYDGLADGTLYPLCANRFPAGEYRVAAKAIRFDRGRLVVGAGGMLVSRKQDGSESLHFEAKRGKLAWHDTVLIDVHPARDGQTVVGTGLDNSLGVLTALAAAAALRDIENVMRERERRCIFVFTDQEEGPPDAYFGQGAARLMHTLPPPTYGCVIVDTQTAGPGEDPQLGQGACHGTASRWGQGSIVPPNYHALAVDLAEEYVAPRHRPDEQRVYFAQRRRILEPVGAHPGVDRSAVRRSAYRL
jgi:hypothetical protein